MKNPSVFDHLRGGKFEGAEIGAATNTSQQSATAGGYIESNAKTGGISVSGNRITWPDNGWYEIQSASTHQTLHEGGQSVIAPNGVYNIINHSTGERFENVSVGTSGSDLLRSSDPAQRENYNFSGIPSRPVEHLPGFPGSSSSASNSSPAYGSSGQVSAVSITHPSAATGDNAISKLEPGTISVSGNTITWPDNAWYEVQSASSHQTIYEGGQSATVPDGLYNVINHSTGERFENVAVSSTRDSGSEPITVTIAPTTFGDINVTLTPDKPWINVANYSVLAGVASAGGVLIPSGATPVAPFILVGSAALGGVVATVPQVDPDISFEPNLLGTFLGNLAGAYGTYLNWLNPFSSNTTASPSTPPVETNEPDNTDYTFTSDDEGNPLTVTMVTTGSSATNSPINTTEINIQTGEVTETATTPTGLTIGPSGSNGVGSSSDGVTSGDSSSGGSSGVGSAPSSSSPFSSPPPSFGGVGSPGAGAADPESSSGSSSGNSSSGSGSSSDGLTSGDSSSGGSSGVGSSPGAPSDGGSTSSPSSPFSSPSPSYGGVGSPGAGSGD